MTAAAPQSRLHSLDSLRGIAALMVVLYHCWVAAGTQERLGLVHAAGFTATAWGELLMRGVAALFGMGRAAVMLFFVLSGFVLAHSLLQKPTTYAEFAVKRLFRIYPAFLTAILASYALHRMIGAPHPAASPLIDRISAAQLSPLRLLEALTLWGTAPTLDIDLVTWSLVHELRISLVFTLILLSVRRARGFALAAYAMLSLGCTLWLHAATGRMAYGFVEDTLPQTFAVTGYFMVFFAGGAWLAIERGRIATWLPHSLAWRTAILVLAGLTLLKGDHGPQSFATCCVDYAHGAASLLVIALILDTRQFSRELSRPVLQWLGRISYSLYLVHLPVLYLLVQTLDPGDPLLVSGAVVLLSLGLAEILARGVEFPGIDLGRRTMQRFAARQLRKG